MEICRADWLAILAFDERRAPAARIIAGAFALHLAENMREISEADDEIDRVVASRKMDVAGLVEDEVILELPMAARHEECATYGDTN